jgi:hypothetical protein
MYGAILKEWFTFENNNKGSTSATDQRQRVCVVFGAFLFCLERVKENEANY